MVAIEVNLSNFFIFYFFPLFTLKVHSWVLFVLILKTYSSVLGILKFVYGLRHANFCILLTNVFYSHWGLWFKAPQDLHLASQQKNASIPDFAFFFFLNGWGFESVFWSLEKNCIQIPFRRQIKLWETVIQKMFVKNRYKNYPKFSRDNCPHWPLSPSTTGFKALFYSISEM